MTAMNPTEQLRTGGMTLSAGPYGISLRSHHCLAHLSGVYGQAMDGKAGLPPPPADDAGTSPILIDQVYKGPFQSIEKHNLLVPAVISSSSLCFPN